MTIWEILTYGLVGLITPLVLEPVFRRMGTYNIIKKEFDFLSKQYGFKICSREPGGSFHYIVWCNSKICIKVFYDDTDNDTPICISMYDVNSVGIDADEYTNEFALSTGKARERIHHAAKWLKNAIDNKIIKV